MGSAPKLESVIKAVRNTKDLRVTTVLRILLAVLFVMTGLMKLFVPMLGEAFSGQLAAAGIPFLAFNVWFVPVAEVIAGVLLLTGFFTRLAALAVINMMLVATYVHIVVNNPALFPLQPEEPYIPIVTIAIALFVLWRGGGSRSLDLKSTDPGS